MKHILAMIFLVAALTSAGFCPAQSEEPRDLSEHQDSVRLTWLTSGMMPPDGLLTFTLGGRNYSTVYFLDGLLERISQKDAFFQMEYSPVSWLNLWGEVPYRTWSGGSDWIPESGSGLADGRWQGTIGRSLVPDMLYLSLNGGGNIPLGDEGGGLGEGVFSPRGAAALTLALWRDNQVPEMRLHFNFGHAWNKNEEFGYGMGSQGFQPWPPRYQSADQAGGPESNDAWTYGGAIEFRQGTTSLWIEYAWERFKDNATVSSSESMRILTAGLRWGLVEGWAVHGDYLVSLADDDEGTEWYPAYPDWSISVGLARQFPLGGSDRDGDGVPDRRDRCPESPEDLDGWQDADGCPDPDNDMDGIPDVSDGAPTQPEDHDGYRDHDGIPDPDNDGDGIPDHEDLCPDEPEDFDGKNDRDGCPDDFMDSDGDGVEDDEDGCPESAEDHDGFEDEDGCPDEDNDLDGIPDVEDDCPDEAEDYDGDRDDDGCPDVDESGEED